MTNGPLPPHERPWRHPSELAAPMPEPTSRTGLTLIISTAAISLLLVGAFAVTMTPDQAQRPRSALDAIAVATTELSTAVGVTAEVAALTATTQPAADTVAAADTTAAPGLRSSVSSIAPVGTDRAAIDSLPGAAAPLPSSAPATLGFDDERDPIVTPIAAGLGVTTASALLGRRSDSGGLPAVLPSGDDVEVEIVLKSGDVVIVTFTGPADGAARPFRHSRSTTTDGDALYVVVDGAVIPLDVELLDEMAAPEGAPVVDASGALVALVSADGGVTALLAVPVAPRLPGDTIVAPPNSEVAPGSSEPADVTTDPATTTVDDVPKSSLPSTSSAVPVDTGGIATTAVPVSTEPPTTGTEPSAPTSSTTADSAQPPASSAPASSEPSGSSEPPGSSEPAPSTEPTTTTDPPPTTGTTTATTTPG